MGDVKFFCGHSMYITCYSNLNCSLTTFLAGYPLDQTRSSDHPTYCLGGLQVFDHGKQLYCLWNWGVAKDIFRTYYVMV